MTRPAWRADWRLIPRTLRIWVAMRGPDADVLEALGATWPSRGTVADIHITMVMLSGPGLEAARIVASLKRLYRWGFVQDDQGRTPSRKHLPYSWRISPRGRSQLAQEYGRGRPQPAIVGTGGIA